MQAIYTSWPDGRLYVQWPPSPGCAVIYGTEVAINVRKRMIMMKATTINRWLRAIGFGCSDNAWPNFQGYQQLHRRLLQGANLLNKTVAVLVIALLAIYPSSVLAEESGHNNLTITVYSCLNDATDAPVITLEPRPNGPAADRRIVAGNATLIEPHVWLLSANVPKGHWYVTLRTAHCAGFFETTSINGEKREFLTATLPHTGGPLYDVAGSLAGSLPFPGKVGKIALLDASSPSDNCFAKVLPGHLMSPVTSGKYFYYDGLLPGDYCLRIYIAGVYSLSRHVHVSQDVVVVEITSAQIESALDQNQ
jgi:hypothetical protein